MIQVGGSKHDDVGAFRCQQYQELEDPNLLPWPEKASESPFRDTYKILGGMLLYPPRRLSDSPQHTAQFHPTT